MDSVWTGMATSEFEATKYHPPLLLGWFVGAAVAVEL